MDKRNFLATIFDWLGDAIERFGPSAFRFLAAVLPYLTPIPVAWLTADSSAEFLNFPPQIAFLFVFALEGIGLWFTSLLVDAVVDWVRSRNWKSFTPVLLFLGTVVVYVYILVNLNVTLEEAVGSPNPALSRVITLLCFLPLLTGIGNGYYKLKLDYKTQSELDRQHREDLELRNRQMEEEAEFRKLESQKDERLQKYRLKYENSKSTSETLPKVPKVRNGSSTMGRPSIHQARVFSYMEESIINTGVAPTFSEVARDLNLPQSTASRLRKLFLENNQ